MMALVLGDIRMKRLSLSLSLFVSVLIAPCLGFAQTGFDGGGTGGGGGGTTGGTTGGGGGGFGSAGGGGTDTNPYNPANWELIPQQNTNLTMTGTSWRTDESGNDVSYTVSRPNWNVTSMSASNNGRYPHPISCEVAGEMGVYYMWRGVGEAPTGPIRLKSRATALGTTNYSVGFLSGALSATYDLGSDFGARNLMGFSQGTYSGRIYEANEMSEGTVTNGILSFKLNVHAKTTVQADPGIYANAAIQLNAWVDARMCLLLVNPNIVSEAGFNNWRKSSTGEQATATFQIRDEAADDPTKHDPSGQTKEFKVNYTKYHKIGGEVAWSGTGGYNLTYEIGTPSGYYTEEGPSAFATTGAFTQYSLEGFAKRLSFWGQHSATVANYSFTLPQNGSFDIPPVEKSCRNRIDWADSRHATVKEQGDVGQSVTYPMTYTFEDGLQVKSWTKVKYHHESSEDMTWILGNESNPYVTPAEYSVLMYADENKSTVFPGYSIRGATTTWFNSDAVRKDVWSFVVNVVYDSTSPFYLDNIVLHAAMSSMKEIALRGVQDLGRFKREVTKSDGDFQAAMTAERKRYSGQVPGPFDRDDVDGWEFQHDSVQKYDWRVRVYPGTEHYPYTYSAYHYSLGFLGTFLNERKVETEPYDVSPMRIHYRRSYGLPN